MSIPVMAAAAVQRLQNVAEAQRDPEARQDPRDDLPEERREGLAEVERQKQRAAGWSAREKTLPTTLCIQEWDVVHEAPSSREALLLRGSR